MKSEEPKESTGGESAKNSPKVKQVIERSPITQSMRVRKFYIPWRRGGVMLI